MPKLQPDDRLSLYRLVERLGRGGFAEVWRARPEPAKAYELRPEPGALARWLRTLTEVLLVRGGPHAAARPVVHHLAQVSEALASPDAPPRLRGHLEPMARDALAWVEELAAGGDLDVAVKVPFHDGYVRQMRREKDILRHVVHPRLVRQVELDLQHEPPFLAMELVKGWSLREALKTEPLPQMSKVLAVMDQLLSVLDHLHRKGMVHGDVKPENIMLEPDGTLRLIDLGLGQVSQAVLRDAYLSLSLASRVPLQGTLSYMAPEVRKGEEPGPAADLYSAGILLYEMLVGDVPHGMTLPTEADPERGLSPRFDVLLKWVLHPEPARRVPTARELRERVLLTLRERPRHQLGTGARGAAREGTLSFDQWALQHASPFVQGDWLGAFQLEEPLGRGGFGEVWKARRAGTTEHDAVALKIALGPHGKDALAREAEVTARLDHPQVPKLLESHLDHDPPYLAIDFVRGRSLRARLVQEGPLTPAEAVTAARSLVDTLAHCHARGVVHQDLKPENLLLAEPSLSLVLLDFGLASASDAAVEQRRAEVSKSLQSGEPGGGTFEYMAPERRRGEPGGPPADVYALGTILFEALTSELPRGLTRLRELCLTASLGLEATVERLLEPDPARRPGLSEVAALLDRERPKEPGVARRATGRLIGRRSRLPERVLTALLGASALALIAAAAAFLLPRPGGPSRQPDVALAEALRDAAARAPGLPAAELRALEERLARTVEATRGASPTAASAAEHRLARVAALRRRREEADGLVEQARWRVSRGRAERQAWTADASATLQGAVGGVDHLLQGALLMARGVEADPGSPDLTDRLAEHRGAWTELGAWREALLARARAEVGDALRSGDDGRLQVAVHLTIELLDDEAGAVRALSPLGAAPLPRALAQALMARLERHLLAQDLHRALATQQALRAVGGETPEVLRLVSAAGARWADARRRLAEVAAYDLPPARALAQAQDAALLLPPRERPERLLAHLRARCEGEALDAWTRVARTRRLAWETIGPPDEARALADLAVAATGDHPQVARLRLACEALAGEGVDRGAWDPALAPRLASWDRCARQEDSARSQALLAANPTSAALLLQDAARARERATWELLEATETP